MKQFWRNGSIFELVLHPMTPLMAFLFFAITTLHQQFSATQFLPIENGLVLVLFFNSALWTYLYRPKISLKWFYLFLAGFALSPLITSFVLNDYLLVFFDSEYRTYLRMLLVSPILIFLLQEKKSRTTITRVVLLSFFVLGLIFFYRLFILGEVRAFDLRPELNLRHGDANFLGTFFAMVFPLALYHGLRQQKYEKILCFALAIFFIGCCLITESRMAIISVLVASVYILITVLKSRQRIYGLMLFSIIGAAILLFAGERILDRFKGIDDKSNYDRTLTLVNGLKVFAASPIVGAGLHKTSESFFDNTESPLFRSEVKSLDVHNAFLKAFSDLGVIGGFLYFLIFMSPWFVFIQVSDPGIQYLKASWIILFMCCLSIGITYKDLVFLNIFLLMGLSKVHNKQEIQ